MFAEEQESVFAGVPDEVLSPAMLNYVRVSQGDGPSSDWLWGFRSGYLGGKEKHVRGSDVKKTITE